MQTLKPCPFCGYALSLEEGVCPVSDAVDDDTGEWKFTGICCPSCAVFLPTQTDDGDTEKGITAWNTRPAAPVDGLEAWKFHVPLNGSAKMIQSDTGEWVQRSQAEAIIAAERNRAEVAEYKLDQAMGHELKLDDAFDAVRIARAALEAKP